MMHRHSWEVWHGQMAPYQDYAQYEGRFISEFGMEAAPSLLTLETVIPPTERFPSSRTMDFHNRSLDGTRRIAVYISDNLLFPTTLEDYIYATQFLVDETTRALLLATNGVLELGQVEWPRDDHHVLSVHLAVSGQVVARASLWPEPFKYLTLPDPESHGSLKPIWCSCEWRNPPKDLCLWRIPSIRGITCLT